MKIVVQRVKQAQVSIEGQIHGQIKQGLLLLGVLDLRIKKMIWSMQSENWSICGFFRMTKAR